MLSGCKPCKSTDSRPSAEECLPLTCQKPFLWTSPHLGVLLQEGTWWEEALQPIMKIAGATWSSFPKILCSKQSCIREVSSVHKTIPFYLEKAEKGWSSLENETRTQDPSPLLLVYIIYDVCVHTYHRGMFKKTWSLGITGSPQRI